MVAKRRIIIFSLTVFLIPFLIPLNSFAENREIISQGQEAFDLGDYKKALDLWQAAALQGNANAQVLVGLAYANGWGVNKNMQAAEMWYHMAAENNNPSGQFLLALYYISSKSDQLKAGMMWLQRAADNGDVSAQGLLQKAEEKRWFENIQRWNPSGQKIAAIGQ